MSPIPDSGDVSPDARHVTAPVTYLSDLPLAVFFVPRPWTDIRGVRATEAMLVQYISDLVPGAPITRRTCPGRGVASG